MTRFVEGLRRFGTRIKNEFRGLGEIIGKVLRPVRKPALRFLRNIPGKIGKWASDRLAEIHDEEAGEELEEWGGNYRRQYPDRVRRNERGEVEITI